MEIRQIFLLYGRCSIIMINWKKEWDEQMRKERFVLVLKKWFAMAIGYGSLARNNMDNAGIAVSKDGIGGAVLLEPYVAWLKTIRRVQQEKPEAGN